MNNLDKKDKMILYELDFNARNTFTKIGKKTGISKEALIYRIKKLEKQGIIEGYFAIPNTPKLGLVSYKVLLKYQSLNNEKEKEMIEFLKGLTNVGWIVRTEGTYDLMFIVWAKNEITFDKLWTEFLVRYSQFLYDKEVLILIENHAYKKVYLTEKKGVKQEVMYKGESYNECDEIDKKIVIELCKNARISALDLSEKIKLTPEAISYRIKKLVREQIIQTFRPKINLEKIGCSYYNILLKLKDYSVINKLSSYAKSHKNITYYVRYLGKYDVGLDIEIFLYDELKGIISDLRDEFGQSISYYDTIRINKEVKITYGF